MVEHTNALDQPLPPYRPTPHNVPVTSPTRRVACPTAVAVFGTVRNVKWAVVVFVAALAVAGCGSSDSTVSKTPGPSVSTPVPAAAPAPAVIPSGPVQAPTDEADPCEVNLAAPEIVTAVSALPRDPRSNQGWNPNRWQATTTSARSCPW